MSDSGGIAAGAAVATGGGETIYARQTLERQKQQRPSSIGYYDLEKNVGEGNFAKVKLATHTLTGQKVNNSCNKITKKRKRRTTLSVIAIVIMI